MEPPNAPVQDQGPLLPDNLHLILEKAHDISFGPVVTVEPVSDNSSCSRSSLSMDHGPVAATSLSAYVSAPSPASAATFRRLPADIVYHILVASDPSTFMSLTLLNREWRRHSNTIALYHLQLLKLSPSRPSFRHGTALGLPPDSDFTILKRSLAKQARRSLWPSCLPFIRLLDMNMCSPNIDLSSEEFHFASASAQSCATAVMYDTSRAFVLDFSTATPCVKHQIAVQDPIVTVALSRDGESVVLVTANGTLRLDRLEHDGIYTVLNLRLHDDVTAVAVTSRASVVAVAYASCVEILAFQGSTRTRRTFACPAANQLEFSEDGKSLLATTTTGSSTTIAKLAPSVDSSERTASLEAAWSLQPISPKAFQNCTHAILLPKMDHINEELVFGYQKSADEFGVFNTTKLTFEPLSGSGILHVSTARDLEWSLPSVSRNGREIVVASNDRTVCILRRDSNFPNPTDDLSRQQSEQSSKTHNNAVTSYSLARQFKIPHTCSAVRWVGSSERESLACFRSVPFPFELNAAASDHWNKHIALVDFGVSVAGQRPVMVTVTLPAETHMVRCEVPDLAEPMSPLNASNAIHVVSHATSSDSKIDSVPSATIPSELQATLHTEAPALAVLPSEIEFEFGHTSEEQEAAISRALHDCFDFGDASPVWPTPIHEESEDDTAVEPMPPLQRSSTWNILKRRSKYTLFEPANGPVVSSPDDEQPYDFSLAVAETGPNIKPFHRLRTAVSRGGNSSRPASIAITRRQSWHNGTVRSDDFGLTTESPVAISHMDFGVRKDSLETSKPARRYSSAMFSTTRENTRSERKSGQNNARASTFPPPLDQLRSDRNSMLSEEPRLEGFKYTIPSLDQLASLRRRHAAAVSDGTNVFSRPASQAPRAARGAYSHTQVDLWRAGLGSHCNSLSSQRSSYAPPPADTPGSRRQKLSSAALMSMSIPEEQETSNGFAEPNTSGPTETTLVASPVEAPTSEATDTDLSRHGNSTTGLDLPVEHDRLQNAEIRSKDEKDGRRKSSVLQLLKFDGLKSRRKTLLQT